MIIFFFVFALAVFPAITLAKSFVVGDNGGWTTGFDYQAWAKGKKFKTGDELIFKYTKGAHNVHKVDGNRFQKCVKPPLKEALTTGNDVITLATPGQKWYICGVANHCNGGQKLTITVTGKAKKVGKNSAQGIVKSWIQVFIAAVLTTGLIIIV
ncbi:Blue copper protein [Thalictrum thalictroides]|uniref:Blue copper protein n=1 Tax=Thalictrum thalictroides TaxID=46969 RepID=A0A7J6XBQ8_THATH|nr:Blue copper protein [Thalictrum thalictroides]